MLGLDVRSRPACPPPPRPAQGLHPPRFPSSRRRFCSAAGGRRGAEGRGVTPSCFLFTQPRTVRALRGFVLLSRGHFIAKL